jgi:cob(I)alamin adenosyltransferase
MPQGQPDAVPDDGLTTRQRRGRPLVVVHTGPGKGKSTAAFGLALRAWNQGWPIAVYQFVKSAKWRVGEENALTTLGASGAGGTVSWHKMGEGWSWIQRNTDDHAERAAEGWAQIRRDLAAQAHRPGNQHVVITGRDAHPKLVAFADLVTEMTKVKHPMDAGQKGQKGIEW